MPSPQPATARLQLLAAVAAAAARSADDFEGCNDPEKNCAVHCVPEGDPKTMNNNIRTASVIRK